MIKTLIKRWLSPDAGAKKGARFGRRREVPVAEHGIDVGLVDKRAIDVVRSLQEAGFEAYIVGGAVRDLLLGKRPKDFDVATNATPEQVKREFRRAFIIGRRFRIVHVVYGRGRDHEVIEVTTFRAFLDNADAQQIKGNEKTHKRQLENVEHAVDASGRVLRDNVWGSMEEDAARRDFTINAMYYDPFTEVVVDYHGGIKDAQKRVLRMIGDAATRYREDPVRIIRAVRFTAKLAELGFKIEKGTKAPMLSSLALLADVPQSRMFDEMLKLLQTGHALSTVNQLKSLGMGQGIYPLLDLAVARSEDPLLNQALADTDRRVGEDKPVAPSYLLACLLWPDVRQALKELEASARRMPQSVAWQQAVDMAFDARIGDVSGRGKLGADMREIWLMQPRFERRTPKSTASLVAQPRFRAAFDFLRLRAHAGELEPELAAWWEDFSLADEHSRASMLDVLAREQRREKGHSRRRGPEASDASAEDEATPASAGEGAAPKRRRRRRRKPNASASGEGSG